ncbi:MAG: hypothetical protein HKN91_17060 [Acidimicrobiia bacterium]|nr:hypothetical protein [Acidimicrobiia bacterium]
MTKQDPIARFHKKTISYTYDNGWSFTNTFDGHTRVTEVPGRGVLNEQIEMTELRPDLYFAAWIDDEMGLIAQVIDLDNGTILAAIPDENSSTQILSGTLTDGGD